jgi:putative transposase
MPIKRVVHDAPPWIDPSREVWFITICCAVRGVNVLAVPGVGQRVLESVAYRTQLGHWHAHLFLLMPDHCHALISFPREGVMKKTISSWKRWTASQYGVSWQADFFDHRLRGDEGFKQKAGYILENPVRAGLVKRPEDWPYRYCA